MFHARIIMVGVEIIIITLLIDITPKDLIMTTERAITENTPEEIAIIETMEIIMVEIQGETMITIETALTEMIMAEITRKAIMKIEEMTE